MSTILSKIDNRIEDAEEELRYTEKQLIDCSQELSEIIKKLSNGVANNSGNMMYSINPLGEIQASGIRIDVLCGKLHEQRRIVKILKKLKESL